MILLIDTQRDRLLANGRDRDQGELPEVLASFQSRQAERLDQVYGHHEDDDEGQDFRQ